MEEEYKRFDENEKQIYTAAMLQGILLGLHSICIGAESKFLTGIPISQTPGLLPLG